MFAVTTFWKPADNLQEPNILPKAEVWSKREDLVFAVTTFGNLLTTFNNQILLKAKILSKREDLVFAVTTFGSLLTISKN